MGLTEKIAAIIFSVTTITSLGYIIVYTVQLVRSKWAHDINKQDIKDSLSILIAFFIASSLMLYISIAAERGRRNQIADLHRGVEAAGLDADNVENISFDYNYFHYVYKGCTMVIRFERADKDHYAFNNIQRIAEMNRYLNQDGLLAHNDCTEYLPVLEPLEDGSQVKDHHKGLLNLIEDHKK